jgi:LPXTG-site transpeptidase (sortase) family protein
VSQNRLSALLITVGTILILTAVTLFVLLWQGIIDDGTQGNSSLETIPGFGAIRTPTPGPSPTPSPEYPPGSDAPIARIVIPAAEIDAPIVVKGVSDDGVMQSPDNAVDVAWYDFSAHPGFGGNAVFAGHVDYIRVGPAVFWNIKDLNPGDLIEVRLEDGTVYQYGVTVKQQYDAATAPVETIVGPTPRETVTLITCSGSFSGATGQYDKRLVVQAERLPADAPAALPPGT